MTGQGFQSRGNVRLASRLRSSPSTEQDRKSVKGAISKTGVLEQGREALRRNAWATAYARLSAADQKATLGPDDLVGLSMAAQLAGKDIESLRLLERAHQGYLKQGDTLRAVRCAVWLGHVSQYRGEIAQAGGWVARAQRLLEPYRAPHR